MELWWFALFIWIGFSTEVATGFGSIIIALALGALLLPFEFMLPILVTLNAAMNLVLLSRLYPQVDKNVFFKGILPLMLVGMVVGIVIFPYMPVAALKTGFALLILWFAGKELLAIRGVFSPNPVQNNKPWLALAGITHGLYASGGPLLVYGLSRVSLNKKAFRATLLATWLTLNLSYAVWFAINGSLMASLDYIVYLLPVLVLAALTGQFLHNKVNEAQFKQLVYWLLILCGLIMLKQSI